MAEPDAELLEQLAVAERHAKSEADRILQLEKLERETDRRTGRRVRLIFGVVISLVWTLAPLFAHAMRSVRSDIETLASVPFSLLSIALILLAAYLNGWGLISPHNRRLGA